MNDDLNQLGVIRVSGDDATVFLQGQLSCDVNQFNAEQASLGLYCNIKGRIIASMRGFVLENQYYLIMPYSTVASTLNTLNKYAVFSKVTLENVSEQLDNLPFIRDPRWRLNDIENGIANIFYATQEQFLPHRLNCHLTGMVDFKKGCFLGQEVLARMHYKAQLKHHMYRFKIITKKILLPGQELMNNEMTIGTIVDAYQANDNEYQTLVTMKTEDSQTTKAVINETAAKLEKVATS